MHNRIRQLREERHMTQVRLSIELEVSQETISAYESGKHYPSVENLIKLSLLFHTSCDYILGISEIRCPLNSHNLTQDEIFLLEQYQSLKESKKIRLKGYLDALLEQ